jgi:hypothetical protein
MRDQERSQKSGSSSNRFTPAEKARDTIGQRRAGRKGGEIKHLAPPPAGDGTECHRPDRSRKLEINMHLSETVNIC